MDDPLRLMERLLVQSLPKQVFQLGDAQLGHSRDKDMRDSLGQILRERLDQLLVEQVAFGDSQHTGLIQQVGIVLGQLVA